ncbi:hypothetical protein, conserved [Trypanosoma brucei gambiense DAL972]|uniref:Thiamin pyrophosphokinase thiamin-binding domain-containing protein n=3 Tax=Trypanosoma brucei TaxID=5691 RepID=Q386F4_TRYB2|nr:hypothetical protein, conserved [Trypanosoma brucei gambiense DAL972]XP_828439.1 hypothetical protein, conserved [Trypanosoma brucei brucei TREU927]EAN79327.1 hypothetical protein, conserved [Trypanosoma brucei brucei TREU927]RHW67983.1 thiamine pyrophosphokinase [Trypanosoma brucei equiperdum]CBH17290.1 hypothetical protein, conserved [Trypanosoma brucei gambiense DAL972]|eukprot:XP_011779554.1 hypothetical protein, conserved [Trypanosoma brucei gambiense DAL972]
MTHNRSGAVRRKVVQHDFYDSADQVGGVVLLNNPTNGSWEYDEYLRLLTTKRYSRIPSWEAHSTAQCYFVCADGVYPKLQSYVKERQVSHPHLRLFQFFPLCDAVIGDMDSYVTSYEKDGCERPSSTPEGGYGTVDDIPVEVLDTIHHRCRSAAALFREVDGSVPDTPLNGWKMLHEEHSHPLLRPLWLHIQCQITTDFKKALTLLKRLRKRYPDENAVVLPPVLRSPGAARILETGGGVVDQRNCGCDNDPIQERELCVAASQVEALLLPTVVAVGAFGGRFDHEVGAISTMLSESHDAHIVLINLFNTVFACQGGGWTQIVRQPEYEDKTCGLVNYGRMTECETSGLLWNVVKGRGRPSVTNDFVFDFGAFISVCNIVRREVITVDLRCLLTSVGESPADATTATGASDCEAQRGRGPPVVFSILRRQKKEGG